MADPVGTTEDEDYIICQSTVVSWLAPFVRSSIPVSRLCQKGIDLDVDELLFCKAYFHTFY